jgi:hypothetical protein
MDHQTVSASPATTANLDKVAKYAGTARSSVASDVVYAHLNDPNFELPRPKSVEDPLGPGEVVAISVVLPGPTDQTSPTESQAQVDKKQTFSSLEHFDE